MQDKAIFPTLEPILIELLNDIHQKLLSSCEDMALFDQLIPAYRSPDP